MGGGVTLSCLVRAFHSPQSHHTLQNRRRVGQGLVLHTCPAVTWPLDTWRGSQGARGAKAQAGTASAPEVSFLHARWAMGWSLKQSCGLRLGRGGHWWRVWGALGRTCPCPGGPGGRSCLEGPGHPPPSPEHKAGLDGGGRGEARARLRVGWASGALTVSSRAAPLGRGCGTSNPTI